MPAKKPRVPSYRLHSTGQAFVKLNGHPKYLGKYGTPESRQKYDRTIAEWMATGRGKFDVEVVPGAVPITVNELVLAFWTRCKEHYRGPDGAATGEVENIRVSLRPLVNLYGTTPAREFGPLKLRAVREQMVADGLARTSVNARINRIRRAFKWGVGMELIPPSVADALKAVEGLQKGRTAARETEPVGPVSVAVVEKTLPRLSRPVAAMVRIQRLTGMRPGEACAMRGRDIVRTPGEATWDYRPESHKTAWRGLTRSIPLGPQAQAIVQEFAKADPDAYLFDPREAVAEHHARRSGSRKSKPTPSERSRRAASPGANHSRRYSRASYLNAINRACDLVFPHPELSKIRPGMLTAEQKAELLAWRKDHRWHPNQLRHTLATEIRSRFGIEGAQVMLGHSKADTTQIYAARDQAKAREIATQTG